MPTYEYRCNACGHQFEQFQSMKDNALKKCPECGKNALERLIGTGAAILFKGSGFYQTDYRSESYKAGEKAASGGDSKPAESAKPDTASKDTPAKPAAKAEPKPDKTKSESKPKKSGGGGSGGGGGKNSG